jgi:hypothetical protein
MPRGPKAEPLAAELARKDAAPDPGAALAARLQSPRSACRSCR